MIDSLLSVWSLATPLSLFGLSSAVLGLRRQRLVAAAPLPRIEPALLLLPPRSDPIPAVETVANLPEVRARMQPKKIVSQAKAAEILVEFMNSEGQHGLFTSKEIDEWWGFAMSARDIERISGQAVREILDARGLKVGQSRLCSPEFAAVRQRNPKSVRPILYRIPRCRGTSGGNPEQPEDVRPVSGPSGAQSGDRPGAKPGSVRQEAA